MTSDLHDTLEELLRSGSVSNPALNALLDGYTKFHVAFIAVAGCFLLAFAVLAAFSWRRFRRARASTTRRWSFERVTYLFFAASSVIFALVMALLVAANASNVADPRHGFSGGLGMLGTPQPGTRAAELHQSFATWLQSGQTDTPTLVTARIDERLAWQRPKAIICSVLLVVLLVLCAQIWRTLIRRSRVRQKGWTPKDVALVAAGLLGGPVCLVLMLMVIGNAQASLAPLSMTLFYG